MDVKFVEYTGSFPNLCSGLLTLEIDGKKYTFGWEYTWDGKHIEGDFPRFWCSGGRISIDPEEVYRGPWGFGYYADRSYKIDKYFGDGATNQFLKVMNDNVNWGCCGGCI